MHGAHLLGRLQQAGVGPLVRAHLVELDLGGVPVAQEGDEVSVLGQGHDLRIVPRAVHLKDGLAFLANRVRAQLHLPGRRTLGRLDLPQLAGELNHLEQVVAERGPLAVAWVLGYSRLDLGKLRGKKGAVVGRGEEVNGLRTRRRTCSRY